MNRGAPPRSVDQGPGLDSVAARQTVSYSRGDTSSTLPAYWYLCGSSRQSFIRAGIRALEGAEWKGTCRTTSVSVSTEGQAVEIPNRGPERLKQLLVRKVTETDNCLSRVSNGPRPLPKQAFKTKALHCCDRGPRPSTTHLRQ